MRRNRVLQLHCAKERGVLHCWRTLALLGHKTELVKLLPVEFQEAWKEATEEEASLGGGIPTLWGHFSPRCFLLRCILDRRRGKWRAAATHGCGQGGGVGWGGAPPQKGSAHHGYPHPCPSIPPPPPPRKRPWRLHTCRFQGLGRAGKAVVWARITASGLGGKRRKRPNLPALVLLLPAGVGGGLWAAEPAEGGLPPHKGSATRKQQRLSGGGG